MATRGDVVGKRTRARRVHLAAALLLLVASGAGPARAGESAAAQALSRSAQLWTVHRYGEIPPMLRKPEVLEGLEEEPPLLLPLLRAMIASVHGWAAEATLPEQRTEALEAIVATRELAQGVRAAWPEQAEAAWFLGVAYHVESMLRSQMFHELPTSQDVDAVSEARQQAYKLLGDSIQDMKDATFQVAIETAMLLRIAAELAPYGAGSGYAPLGALDVADRIDPRNTVTLPERLRCAALALRSACVQKDMTQARETVVKARELLGKRKLAEESDLLAGAWNLLVEATLQHRVAGDGLELATETRTSQHLTLERPRGIGWRTDETPFFPSGDYQFRWSRLMPTGGRVQLQISSYRWDKSYAGAGGDNSKGLFDVLLGGLERRLELPKRVSSGRPPLPRWAKGVRGTKLEMRRTLKTRTYVWMWVFKSTERRRTFMALVRADGLQLEDLPADVAEMLKSMEEREDE